MAFRKRRKINEKPVEITPRSQIILTKKVPVPGDDPEQHIDRIIAKAK